MPTYFLMTFSRGASTETEIDPDKSLSDYIGDYRSAAKNDQIHRFAEAIGVNEDKLRNIISLHIPDNMLNQGGHYSELVATPRQVESPQLP